MLRPQIRGGVSDMNRCEVHNARSRFSFFQNEVGAILDRGHRAMWLRMRFVTAAMLRQRHATCRYGANGEKAEQDNRYQRCHDVPHTNLVRAADQIVTHTARPGT